jgi:molybdopterin-guanine dinucleotide biosynthesis protein A
MIAGLVLAGGQASRMGGGDKCLLTLDGKAILQILLERLSPQVASMAISANGAPDRFASYGLPVLPDAVANAGPLAGVAAGLAWANSVGATSLLTVPADTPLIPADLAARLTPAPAWAESGGALHPLVALWPSTSAPTLAAWLEGGGSLRVRAFGTAIGMRAVVFADDPEAFFNINTPADLAVAREIARALPLA